MTVHALEKGADVMSWKGGRKVDATAKLEKVQRRKKSKYRIQWKP